MYLTRKCRIEIKNLLYKRILAKTAAAARHAKFQTIQDKTVKKNHSMNKTKTKTQVNTTHTGAHTSVKENIYNQMNFPPILYHKTQ